MQTPSIHQIAVARLENERAAAPYSRSGIPRQGLRPGWNLEDTPSALRAESPGFAEELPAASVARLARLRTLAQGPAAPPLPACPPAITGEDERRIPMPFMPPRFKTVKKGPNAGQVREEKWMLRLLTRTVTAGAKVWKVTTAAKGDGVKPPASAGGTSFTRVHADLRCRYTAAEADRLTAFLRFAE
jgi:hypothetical protein